jgi:hypothetical protein
MRVLVKVTNPFLIFSISLMGMIVVFMACGSDDDDDDSVCDSRDSDYYRNCDKACSEESEKCREECGPNPTGVDEGACDSGGWGDYDPIRAEYTDYCTCLTNCSSGWLTCMNECYAPCGEVML